MLALNAFSQDSTHPTAVDSLRIDTIAGKGQKIAMELPVDNSEMDRNMRYIQSIQRKQKEKQKKQAMLYLGMGFFFLAVLVVSIVRRRRKTVNR